MVTGATGIFFPLSKSHICIGRGSGQQAGVSLMENIPHNCSDGDWLMDNQLKCRMC